MQTRIKFEPFHGASLSRRARRSININKRGNISADMGNACIVCDDDDGRERDFRSLARSFVFVSSIFVILRRDGWDAATRPLGAHGEMR